MRLQPKQESRATRIRAHLIISNIETLKENGIEPCQTCKTSGLKYTQTGDYDFMWDCESYCDDCKGVGYIGLKKRKSLDGQHYICGVCNGIGCSECKYTGITDCISHLMGR